LCAFLGLGWIALFPLVTITTCKEGGREGGMEGGREKEHWHRDAQNIHLLTLFPSLPPSLPPQSSPNHAGPTLKRTLSCLL
jgi:hypothetical protein